MKRMWYSIAGVTMLLLLGLGACNLPRFSGDGTDGRPAGPTNTDGAETILIPGGTFWMGSEPTEAGADADEQPSHQVTLESFYLYTHEVTNEMYAACVEAGACIPVNVLAGGPTSHFEDPEFGDNPAVGADWLMARDYCAWAGGRLPTEAEWELAARGTESLPYPWGDEEPDCSRVNMLGCLVPPDTMAVGSFELGNSPYDVWDMAGNVWEWVHDWYDEDYYALSPASSPLGPAYSELKVARSGGLYSDPEQMRTAARAGTNPYRAYDDVGFRCVAMGELDLPADYAGTDERHEWVPPDPLDGGGEPLEDPDDDPWYSTGMALVSCPDSEGRMHIFAEADTSEAVTYTVEVNGSPFDCYYDEMLRGLQCEGPIPENNDELDHYTIDVHFNPGGIGHYYPDRPLDCPAGGVPPIDAEAWATCPGEGGLVTIGLTYMPPITWDTTQYLEGMSYVDMPCVPTSVTTMSCTVPARAPGESYSLYLHGFGAGGGGEYYFWTTANIPADCLPTAHVVTVEPFCFEDTPGVIVRYPSDVVALSSVSTIGVPLSCIGMAPGVQFCGRLPGTAGSTSTVTTCFAGEPCRDWMVTVPACPAAEPTYEIVSGCYPGLGPVVTIQYLPADQPLVAANANGFDLTCLEVGSGQYGCYTLPGAPGSTMTVTFCLADGTCYSQEIVVPPCEEETTTEWTISGYGCHDETDIFFSVDTGFEWLVPGADYTYSASDEEGSYSCSLIPAVPGRMYCSGPRPETPGTLQVCVHPDGGPLSCEYFEEFPGLVAAIPDCAPPPEEPPDTGPSCADYDIAVCNDHPECHWEKIPAPGYCADGGY